MQNFRPIKIDLSPLLRVQQGDIFKDIEHIESIVKNDKDLTIKKISFPYVIVLTQDCDLAQDSAYYLSSEKRPSNDDKKLFSVIVAPIYNEEHFLEGQHLSDLGYIMQTIDRGTIKKPTTTYKSLLQNEIPRFHHLVFPPDCSMVNSVIDFKHYFTISSQFLTEIKPSKHICKVSELFRERISQRFSNFLSRIGLPE